MYHAQNYLMMFEGWQY